MSFSYCKKCCQLTDSKDVVEFVVVVQRRVLKKFDDFYLARAWANDSDHAARVEERIVGKSCALCKSDK